MSLPIYLPVLTPSPRAYPPPPFLSFLKDTRNFKRRRGVFRGAIKSAGGSQDHCYSFSLRAYNLSFHRPQSLQFPHFQKKLFWKTDALEEEKKRGEEAIKIKSERFIAAMGLSSTRPLPSERARIPRLPFNPFARCSTFLFSHPSNPTPIRCYTFCYITENVGGARQRRVEALAAALKKALESGRQKARISPIHLAPMSPPPIFLRFFPSSSSSVNP